MNNAISRLILIAFITLCLSWGGITQAGERSRQKLPNPEDLRFQQIHFKQPQAQRVRLDNGIVIYIFEDHEIPLVNVSAVIRTGSNYDPGGKEGLAELTGTVLRTGGTKTQTGDTVDASLDSMAGTIHVSINRDSSSLNLSILKKDFDEGFRIFSRMITEPAFEEKKLALAKDLIIEDLKRIADDPKRLAFREFKRVLFAGNPLGRFPSARSVESVRRDDIALFHNRFFYPENIMISITGDVSKEEAIAKVREHLGSWHVPGVRPESLPVPAKPQGKVYFFPKDTPQTIIICSSIAPGKRDKDQYPFEVLDFILGSGGFKSRIFQEIRNNRGLAYSTGSFYTKRGEYGVFGTYAMTESRSTASVLLQLRSIVEGARTTTADMKELDWATKSINNNFIFAFQSAEQIARQQLMLEYDGLPADYLAAFRDRIARVKPEDVKQVAVKYLSGDETVTFILGNEDAYKLVIEAVERVSRIEDRL